jgi:hypothetical protein
MHDDHAHHAHRHLNHLVGMRMVHERPALLHLELVDKGLAGRDVRLVQAADAVHAARNDHAVPVHGGVFGQSVGDEDADLVAFDRLDGRPRRLAVIAPEIDLHAFGEFAHHGLGDEMEFLPVAVHAERQRPAVEGDDGTIIRPALRMQRRLHHHLVHVRGFRNRCGLDAAADCGCACQRGGAQKSSAGKHLCLHLNGRHRQALPRRRLSCPRFRSPASRRH